jgi:Cof subfamily protein (haloacid dehalogenase superfamily)
MLPVSHTVRAFAAAACDLDGTLLEGSNLSDANARAVEKLKHQGARVILATGRNFHQVGRYHSLLNLTTPTVTSDGALVSTPGGSVISERPLAVPVSDLIMEEAATRGISCLNYFRHGVHVTSRFDWNVGMERHTDMGRFFRYCKRKSMRGKCIYKILLYSGEPAKLDELQALITQQCGDVVDTIRNAPNVLEFVAKGVSKVYGLNIVANLLGFAPENALAFGDGVNDVGMFRWAGLSVCMHHGHDAAKQAATMVAPDSSAATNFAAAVDAVLALPRAA